MFLALNIKTKVSKNSLLPSFQAPVMISEEQLNTFRDIVDVDRASPIVESESDNFRETQPLNRRRLLDVHTPPSKANSLSSISRFGLLFITFILSIHNQAFLYFVNYLINNNAVFVDRIAGKGNNFENLSLRIQVQFQLITFGNTFSLSISLTSFFVF